MGVAPDSELPWRYVLAGTGATPPEDIEIFASVEIRYFVWVNSARGESNLPSCRLTDEPVAEVVQCGEPAFAHECQRRAVSPKRRSRDTSLLSTNPVSFC